MLFKLHDFFLEIYKIKRNCTSNYAIYMANDTHTHTHTYIYEPCDNYDINFFVKYIDHK